MSRKSQVVLFSILTLLVPLEMRAQAAKHPQPAARASLTVEDVVKMAQAGLSDEIIIQKIKSRNEPFDLSTDQLLQLKAGNVSNQVIEVMMDPSKAESAPATALAPIPAPPPPADAPVAAGVADSEWPTEIGVYYKKQGKWSEILPEIVNWKSGGVVKSIASVGIVKGDMNGHLVGPHSRSEAVTPLEFAIVMPEGTAITEYQLLRLRAHGGDREFRTVTGGVMHVQSGATRDAVQFEGKRISGRVYSVVLPLDIGTGEYGFLPPGAVASTNAAGSAGKMYSFHVME